MRLLAASTAKGGGRTDVSSVRVQSPTDVILWTKLKRAHPLAFHCGRVSIRSETHGSFNTLSYTLLAIARRAHLSSAGVGALLASARPCSSL